MVGWLAPSGYKYFIFRQPQGKAFKKPVKARLKPRKKKVRH
tara:strand:+ start:3973 stop:4095 length:123 start_codon:yes stop_codon:yes gene_type:complete